MKRDPKMERYTDVVGSKLASILQKPEIEMQMMLRRTHYLNRKKEKKNELDKCQTMIKLKVDSILKINNRKSEAHAIELAELKPDFTFNPDLCARDQSGGSAELKKLCYGFTLELKEFVALNNKYVECKVSEERAKVSQPSL